MAFILSTTCEIGVGWEVAIGLGRWYMEISFSLGRNVTLTLAAGVEKIRVSAEFFGPGKY